MKAKIFASQGAPATLPDVNAAILRERLKEARLRAKFATVAEAAQTAGVSESVLYKYENGDTLPGAVALFGISKAYGVSVDWLLGLRADPTGLPVGQFIVRDAVVQAVLEAQVADEVASLLRDTDPLDWWHQVEPQTRIASLEDWLRVKEKVREKLAPMLGKLKKIGAGRWKTKKHAQQ